MKKNYLFGLISLFTVLFAASCQEEDMAGGQMGDTATVTFQVNTPMLATRAVGDGTAVGKSGKLYVAVYEKDDEGWSDALGASKITPENAFPFEYVEGVATATVPLDLAKNKDYSIVFWAETNENGDAYRIDWNEGGKLSLNTTNLKANQESYDAFWAQTPVNLTGAMTKTIELKRPFAQLNIGTSDKEAAKNAGIVVEKTKVTVKQIPTTLNFQVKENTDGHVGNYDDVIYEWATIVDDATTTDVKEGIEHEEFPADKPNQSYLALNYLLVNEKITVDVNFQYKDAQDDPYELNFPSVPVQRNFRTNIYGTLLTNSANYTVGIKPEFGNGSEEDVANIVYASTAEEMAVALTADEKNIEVRLLNDIELPISSLGSQTPGSGEYKLGSEKTENIVIDLNGKKLTITTSYMSAIGAKKSDALITVKNGTMTSTGNKATTWNIYDLIFANCNYQIENVVFEKPIAFDNVGKSVSVKNVTISETKDLYAMWICAVGQTINIDGLVINSEGRGIKIDEQYVGNPAKVTLNINNATFKTAKKAAIMVKSAAGAEINASNLNIENVTADKEYAVWVDEEAAAYADLVVVKGAKKIVEGTVLASDLNSIKEVFANGGYVMLKDDITFEKITPVEEGKEVYLDLNGKTITVDENTASNTLIWVKDDGKLTIDGNGTINLGSVSTMAIFCPYGELVINNGTFIRDKVTTVTNATTGLFMGAKNSDCNVTINGGYFDAGYYDTNAADIEEILAGTKEFTETDNDRANQGKPGDKNLVRVAVKDNVSVLLNHSGYGSFKVYGGTFVGANPAWGDEGCMLPTTPNYLRPWSYYQGALLDGQTFNENGLKIPDRYNIERSVNADNVPVYTVTYNQ